MSIAQFIDHTILKPSTSLSDIEKICNEVKEYGFAAACVPPYFVRDAKQILGEGRGLATVIGFPFGYSHYDAKMDEVFKAMEDGANELDMVINIAALKRNDIAWLENEISVISVVANDEGVQLKLIIETGILTEAEIIKCCELYRNYPVDYLKTSTGYAEKGATVEAVQIMRKHLPDDILIKASGGIKTFAFARQLKEAGATRLGCSASVAIVNEENGITTAASREGY